MSELIKVLLSYRLLDMFVKVDEEKYCKCVSVLWIKPLDSFIMKNIKNK